MSADRSQIGMLTEDAGQNVSNMKSGTLDVRTEHRTLRGSMDVTLQIFRQGFRQGQHVAGLFVLVNVYWTVSCLAEQQVDWTVPGQQPQQDSQLSCCQRLHTSS